MDEGMLTPSERVELAKIEHRMNHVAMGVGVLGLAVYSVIEYYILPRLWSEFLVCRLFLAVLGLGLMTFTMLSKRFVQTSFYVFWILVYIFGAYGASKIIARSDLFAWNIHLAFYMLLIAGLAVSPPRFTWILSVGASVSYLVFFIVHPSVSLSTMLVNGGLIFLSGLILFPIIMFVRYRLYVQNIRLRKKIADQNEELLRANASKDRFFSLLAHDLKGPIGSSKRILERLAKNGFAPTNEDLQAVSDAINRSFALLENLLWWARCQRGELTVLPVEISVEQLVDRAWREMAAAAERRKIVLEKAIDRSAFVIADKKLVHTILLNLLSNAVKYSPPGGTITVSSLKRDGLTVIEVKDSGPGMDDEKLRTLFKIDEKQGADAGDGERGSGLGLIVSREFAVKNGGTLSITSAPGQGTTVYLELPSG